MNDSETTEVTEPETGQTTNESTLPQADQTQEPEPQPEKGKDNQGDEVAKWKALARKNETLAKRNKEALDKALAEQQAILDNIAQALGLKKADEDPQKVAEKLTAELTSTRDELRQARVELAVYKAASRHGGDPDALLDSRSFLRAVAQLNPDDDGFADAIADAIKDAIKANPKLAAQPAPEKAAPPPRSGGEMPGAPARGNTKRPTGLAAAIRRHYGH